MKIAGIVVFIAVAIVSEATASLDSQYLETRDDSPNEETCSSCLVVFTILDKNPSQFEEFIVKGNEELPKACNRADVDEQFKPFCNSKLPMLLPEVWHGMKTKLLPAPELCGHFGQCMEIQRKPKKSVCDSCKITFDYVKVIHDLGISRYEATDTHLPELCKNVYLNDDFKDDCETGFGYPFENMWNQKIGMKNGIEETCGGLYNCTA